MPKVSVLIPMYNAQDTIEHAVLSANQLDLGGVEVIIVDDASRDQSLQVVDELNLECVRIISAGSNRGPSFCRNVGLELAVGEWIAVLDSDDWFSKGRLSKLIGIAETNGLDLIADDQWLWGGSPIRPMRRRSETLSILRQTDKPYNVNIKTLLENVGLGITQPIFRRSFLEKHNIRYRTDYRYGEDFRLLYDVVSRGARMGIVNEPLYNVRLHNRSLTANRVKMYSGMIEVLEGIRSELPEEQYKSERQALERSIKRARKTRDYGSIVDPIKRKEYVIAAKNLLCTPWALLDIVRRSFSKLGQWIRG